MKEYMKFKEDCLYQLEGMTTMYLSDVLGRILTKRVRNTLTCYYEALIYNIYVSKTSGKDRSRVTAKIHGEIIGYVKALTNMFYAEDSLNHIADDAVDIIRKELE